MDQVRIGKFIADRRKSLELTQTQLADRLGVSDKSVSKWECGKCLPDASIYESLCKELGISINDFFAGEIVSGERTTEQSEGTFISYEGNTKMKKTTRRDLFLVMIVAIIFSVGIYKGFNVPIEAFITLALSCAILLVINSLRNKKD